MTNTSSRIAHLVLTGGPCAGKSSAMTYLTDRLRAQGWRVLVAPEAATLLITGGVDDIGHLAATDREAYLAVQTELVSLQVNLRARFDLLAQQLPGEKVVVLHDRGVADNAAYMDDAEYAQVLAGCGLDAGSAYELYDGVVHLRSAAVPAAGYKGEGYTTANNAARTETAAAAAALDTATLGGWVSHPHLHVVGSAGSFTQKLERTADAVFSLLGEPVPVEVERKFWLRFAPDLAHPELEAAAVIDIEQIYLPDTDAGEQRVRARTLAGITTYFHTAKTETGDAAKRVEVETAISAETYAVLATLRAPGTAVVRKRRRVFVVGNQRFELDEITAPVHAWLLEAELVDTEDELEVPEFLGVFTEVTEDRSWRNRAIAERRPEQN